MTRGGSRPWWSPVVPGPDEMTYECDASLGSPSEVDCLHIQWDQLSPASDTVQVGPGSTTFLHSSKLIPKTARSLLTQDYRHVLSCYFRRGESGPDLGPNPSRFGHPLEYLRAGSDPS